jgi:hypothetical protein
LLASRPPGSPAIREGKGYHLAGSPALPPCLAIDRRARNPMGDASNATSRVELRRAVMRLEAKAPTRQNREEADPAGVVCGLAERALARMLRPRR